MMWTWLGIAVAVFILVLGFWGYHRGFIREVVATSFLILSLVLVYMLNPYVKSFLIDNTPLEEKIQESCDELVAKSADGILSMGEEGQETLLRNLKLPSILTDQLIESNTGKTYQELAVTDFTEYVSGFLANMLMNGISFLLTYVSITILVKLLLYIQDLIAKLPLIHGLNQIAGGLVGAGKGLIIVWILMLILTLLAGTEPGKITMELIAQDTFLRYLYSQNLLMKLFLNYF